MTALVVTGTDTGIGKTVVAAMLTLALDAVYWKPVQSGTADGSDTATVAALTGLGPESFVLERYVLTEPLSPHHSAELDGIEIDPHALTLPAAAADGRLLIVEGAGGLMVPITRRTLYIDVFQRWGVPVVLVARTALGTINHSLLSIEALRRRDVPILGIVFVGDSIPDTERTICEYADVTRLGRLPRLPELNAAALQAAFSAHFHAEDFIGR
ncbi:MAG: ATP-dependent dethiobiotin synthetase BioD [Rhodospirillales bacterium]|nr:ATP-dependent dethiobiotin synthetase BioD [Rhodospirillales bacterium]